MPENIDAVDSVKYTESIGYPDISIKDLFNDLFTGGEWVHSESKNEYDIVEYIGEKEIKGTTRDFFIVFISVRKVTFVRY